MGVPCRRRMSSPHRTITSFEFELHELGEEAKSTELRLRPVHMHHRPRGPHLLSAQIRGPPQERTHVLFFF